MTLTVPTGGTNPGRAAAVQVEASPVGDMIARAGDVALQVGTRLEEDRLSREAQRTQVDMTRDLNNLRLELQEIGDPDALDAAWTQRSTALRNSYLEGTTDEGRRRVDPKNAERIGLAFDDMANRHALAIGARSLEARQSQREASWLAYEHEAANAAALGNDPGLRDVLIARADEQLAEMVASGVISPEEAMTRSLSFRGGIANETAIRQVANDPQGFLEAAEAGAYGDLSAETVARYSVQAQNAIDTAAAAAAREEKAAEDARNREIGDRLGDYRDIFAADRTPVDEAFMARPEVQAHPDFARTQAALELSRERADLPFYTPDQLRSAISDERQRPVDQPYQTERLELLQDQLAKAEEGWGRDAIAHAKSIGLPVAPLPDFDPANPQPFIAALGQRQTQAQQLVAEGYIDQPRALDEDERAMIRTLAATDQDPQTRVALAQAIMPNLRGVGVDDASNFIDDRVFLHVGGELAAGAISPRVAADIFRGQQVLAEGNVVEPSRSERLDAAFQTVDALFADLPNGETLQGDILASADALYAARVRRSDPTGDIDETVYRQALHEVMGGSGTFDGRGALGGVQTVRGVPTVLPAGVNSRNVDAALDALTQVGSISDLPAELRRTDDRGRNITNGYDQRAYMATQRLLSASLTGAGPAFEGEDLLAILDQADIQAVADDRYVFVYRTARGPAVLYDAQGRELQFSLKALTREVRQ